MKTSIVVLAERDSVFARRVERHVADRASVRVVVDVGAPGADGGTPPATITVAGEQIQWDRASLDGVGVVFAERIAFAWPQPHADVTGASSSNGSAEVDAGSPSEGLHSGGAQRVGAPLPLAERMTADRQARALTVSARAVAADRVRFANPVEAAVLAASPAIALARLERADVRVAPWRLAVGSPEDGASDGVATESRTAAPEAAGADGTEQSGEAAPRDTTAGRSGGGWLRLDAAGRDAWHEPQRPAPDDEAVTLACDDAPVVSYLVVGGDEVAAVRYDDASTWADVVAPPPRAPDPKGIGEPVARLGVPAEGDAGVTRDDGRALALEAAAVLGLDVAAISIVGLAAGPAVAWVEASPRLDVWDARFDGAVARALADHLVALANAASGADATPREGAAARNADTATATTAGAASTTDSAAPSRLPTVEGGPA